ncbi:glutaredoxin domain-containing protein [Aedoeadaptatus pacaensis]|uniref:glutaredoxin domain-containing protein n=1 Tax=Aedoeadaptatus pacaensis TaxID=1776390 RepID=UPI000839A831|nr:glutaredoxin domain-containing protein [Peptoniphilus pacaensis]
MKIYGTDLCPDCVEAKKKLDEKNIPYDYVDITASIGNLKAFMKMRDEEPAFDEAKKAGAVGVPAFVLDDGEIRLEIEI